MSVEELLHRWAARRLDLNVDDVLSVEFFHEDGWGNDSGTWWPGETYAIVKSWKSDKHDRKRTRTQQIPVGDAYDIPNLLQEILDT